MDVRQAPDPDGFDELFRWEHDAIARAAYLITGQRATAAEVTQDAFAEAFVHWRRVRHLDRPGAWVRRVAIRRAIKVRERDRRRDELMIGAASVAGTPAAGHPGDGEPPTTDVGLDLARALDSLTPRQRALVVLHYLEDLTVIDAAAAVGCRPATASVHLHRARQRLADLLDDKVHTDAR